MEKPRICKDCWAQMPGVMPPPKPWRAAPYPGPRCATHHRARNKAGKGSAHAKYVQRTYGLLPGEYTRILSLQGGVCYLCRRAKGITKRLAVDHDHACCPETPTCGRCTRGLLCGPCNKLMGHLRDDPAAFTRGAEYLRLPPARIVIWERGPNG